METTRLERICRSLVRPVALLITCAWLLADACYASGRLLRLAIHDRSEQLADLHCRALGLTRPVAPEPPASAAPATALPLPFPAPARPVLPPVAMACAPARPTPAIAPPALDTLSVAQLRSLARSRGHRGARIRNARRSDLLRILD